MCSASSFKVIIQHLFSYNFFFPSRISIKMKEREAMRRANESEARMAAVARQKGPYHDLDVVELRNCIQQRTGKRPRYSSKVQLMDILWFLDQETPPG